MTEPHGWTFPILDTADVVPTHREVQYAGGSWTSWQRVDGGGWTSHELDWPEPANEDDARRIATEQLERGEVA